MRDTKLALFGQHTYIPSTLLNLLRMYRIAGRVVIVSIRPHSFLCHLRQTFFCDEVLLGGNEAENIGRNPAFGGVLFQEDLIYVSLLLRGCILSGRQGGHTMVSFVGID